MQFSLASLCLHACPKVLTEACGSVMGSVFRADPMPESVSLENVHRILGEIRVAKDVHRELLGKVRMD